MAANLSPCVHIKLLPILGQVELFPHLKDHTGAWERGGFVNIVQIAECFRPRARLSVIASLAIHVYLIISGFPKIG